jgi:hypothetical protein
MLKTNLHLVFEKLASKSLNLNSDSKKKQKNADEQKRRKREGFAVTSVLRFSASICFRPVTWIELRTVVSWTPLPLRFSFQSTPSGSNCYGLLPFPLLFNHSRLELDVAKRFESQWLMPIWFETSKIAANSKDSADFGVLITAPIWFCYGEVEFAGEDLRLCWWWLRDFGDGFDDEIREQW